jgi:hypothetical protein
MSFENSMQQSDPQGGAAVQAAPPIIIWTFRRTGGTSLRGILFWLTRRPSFQDEAFNDLPPRELGGLTTRFREDRDEDALRLGIREAFAERYPNLKHCIENVPFRLNSVLIEEAAKLGYRHILLLRLNEIDRQVSLEIARQTGAWGPEVAIEVFDDIRAGRREMPALNLGIMRRQVEADAAALGKLLRLFMLFGQKPVSVFFESLYTGPLQDRYAAFRLLAADVGIPGANELSDSVFHKSAADRGQNSASMLRFIPNIQEVLDELKEIVR